MMSAFQADDLDTIIRKQQSDTTNETLDDIFFFFIIFTFSINNVFNLKAG